MQKRYVSIWLPHLATDWHIRKQPSLLNAAFVLKAPSHNRMVVMAASVPAQQQGIAAGMVLADAKALCPSIEVLDHKPGLTDQLLQRIAEWCIRFTPIAGPDSPAGILLDATGCTHLWGGEEAYLKDIINRLAARGYTARAAIADTVGASWAWARYGGPHTIIQNNQQKQSLLSLTVSALRLGGETVVRLHKLGLRQIGDIASLPPSAIRRRFGPLLLQRLRQAWGDEEELLTPVYPPLPFQERLPCLEPIVTLTGIEMALERLLAALCNRLRKEGKGARNAVFRCYRIDGGAQGIEIGTNRPLKTKNIFFIFLV
jgi:protein ImuB